MGQRDREQPDFPPGNDEVASRGGCLKCDTEMGNVTYQDGHSHCFACGHKSRGAAGSVGGAEGLPAEPVGAGGRGTLLSPADYADPWTPPRDRGLTAETIRKFGYFRAKLRGEWIGVAPYHDAEGLEVSQKVRTPAKDFMVLKAPGAESIGSLPLWGRHVFGDRYNRRVVVCEGEIDAMSVAQATDFKFAVVSLNAGAQSAAKSLKANYLWLHRFEEIVLWFDNDEPGEKARAECAPLFAVGKVKIAKAPDGMKDANDLLKVRPGDIMAAIYAAPQWRPRGIVNARNASAAILAPREKTVSYSYPASMPRLQEMMGGMFPGDVIYHVAGTGIGKSAVFREIAHDLVSEQGIKTGILSFEDTLRDMQMGLMSISASRRLHLVPVPDPGDAAAVSAYDALMLAAHQKVFASGLVELFDPENAEWQLDAILSYIRYLAKALDCKVAFLDPLSFVAAGIDLSADERRVLDKVAMELAKMAKELGLHIQVSHHLKRTSGVPHEEGAPTSLNELRSSGGLANFAMGVIGWERNNQAADDDWRIMQSRIIKPSRRTGRSGLADVLHYGEDGRLRASTRPFPSIGKPGGDGNEPKPGRHQGFPAVDY